MAQVKTIGEAVRNMSVHMANMYYCPKIIGEFRLSL